jgi:hypothetical protein
MKPKPSVVQLLRLPGVAKMEAVNTGAAGRDVVADQAGWVLAQRIGQDGVRARELHVSGAGAGALSGQTWPSERDGRRARELHASGAGAASGCPGTSCPVKKTMKLPVYIIARYTGKMKTIYQISN